MRNKIYAGMLFLAFAMVCNFSFSQFYLGAQLNYSRYLGGSGINSIGLGVHGETALGDGASSLRFGLNFGLPAKKVYAYDLEPYNYNDAYSEVNVTQKYGFLSLNVDFKHYFFDGDYEDGGFYVFGGLGLTMATITYKADTYDETKYTLGFDPDDKDRLFQPILRFGPGYDINLGSANIFFEGFLNLPANRVGASYININIPASVGLQAGVKFPIGG